MKFFYEIFEYLYDSEVYEAFSNLNYRFEKLINSSSLLFKFTHNNPRPGEIFINTCKKIIRFNRQQILSIHL